MEKDPAIRIRDLQKVYAPAGSAAAKHALKGVSFDVTLSAKAIPSSGEASV